jgi:hypothetical protein
MTTKKRRTTTTTVVAAAAETVVDHDGHDIVEEVVVKQLPQLYQSTISVSVGPHEPKVVVGHIQFSDTTGLITAICQNSSYDVELDLLARSGIVSKDNSAVMFSPQTKAWMLNIHKVILPRNWAASEAWNRDEV